MIQITETENGYLYRCDFCGWQKVHPRRVKMNCRECSLRDRYPDMRDVLKDPRRNLKEPSLMIKANNLAKAAYNHAAAGMPQATDEQVAERFAICASCEIFKPTEPGEGVCTHKSCGCNIKAVGLTGRNKLRWADQRCPIGKWEAIK